MWWKKYLRQSIVEYKSLMAYKLNFIVGFLNVPMSLLLYFFIWQTIYAQGVNLPYTFKEMVGYLAIASVSTSICYTQISETLEDEIIRGSIVNDLCRPFDRVLMDLAKLVSRFGYALINGVPYLILFIVLFDIPVNLNPLNLGLFLVSLFLGKLINHFMSYMIGTVTFWTERIWGLTIGLGIISGFMSGSSIPLDLFPPLLQNIAFLLPFRFTAFTPVRVLQDKATIMEFALMLGWALILGVSAKILFNNGVHQYDAKGG